MSETARSPAPDGRPEDEQPDWRREFPVDVPQDNYVSRREFTRFLGLTSLAFVVGQFWIGLRRWLGGRPAALEPQTVARLDEVPVGGARTFTYPDEGSRCLLLRLDERTVVAYDQKCTHLSCAVVPRWEEGQLHCPCHNGSFDLRSGRPVAGPPRRPLPRITLEVRDGVVYATGVEVRTT
jgi:nitrite reductase/ring-hydroxylating ferredoxin subunit